jgi:phosphohistidine swiveling domain-containing protein
MEFGGRLAQAEMLDAANDAFYLTPEELQNSRNVPMKRLVQERRAEMEHFSHVPPPLKLGTMPAFELEDGGPVMPALSKGEFRPSGTSPHEAHSVKGIPGSARVARGTARVIHSLAEAGKLQPGDVLVAEFTVRPWTPLFARASAIVTDSGGVLCHSAVVAREYRIPAVVGTGHAASTFQDGQLLGIGRLRACPRISSPAGIFSETSAIPI